MDAYTGALADFKLSVGKIREQFMGDTPEAIALREKYHQQNFCLQEWVLMFLQC